jgi:hypothetical protein
VDIKEPFSNPKISLSKNGLSVSIPNVPMLKAYLVNLRGQVAFHGQITNQGNAEFPQMLDGVYFLHYLSATGPHSVSLGLLSPH